MDRKIFRQLHDLLRKKETNAAAELCLQCYRQSPADREVQSVYGQILQYTGKFSQAEGLFRCMIENDSLDAAGYLNLARALAKQSKVREAVATCQKALRLKPELAEAYDFLALLLILLGDYEAAVAAYAKAETLMPDYQDIMIHLTWWMDDPEQLRYRVDRFQVSMASNKLFTQSYYVLCSPDELLLSSRQWAANFSVAAPAELYSHRREETVDRRLRIGYVSPDFQQHSVSYFFEPLLAAHDRGQVEVYCYSELKQGDAVTARLQGLADGWRVTAGRTAQQVAEQIYADEIDILIDLAGHTANNRLQVFSYKPAPVQITYLGYFATTGLAAMDYWLTDEVLTPADTVEQASETLWRLPRCCLSYEGPSNAPAVSQRPTSGAVVFGNFNDLSKAGPGAVASWSAIMKRLPESRLILKARQLGDSKLREEWWAKFEAEGIERDRVELRGRTATIDVHLGMYADIDIALDTMPRTGGTTTAEALWMGVPVISLAGERFIERLSATMLTAVGLSDLVASSREDYIERAVALAEDGERRQRLRGRLRQQLQDSPLCDHRGLAAAMEEAYRAMWMDYMASADGSNG